MGIWSTTTARAPARCRRSGAWGSSSCSSPRRRRSGPSCCRSRSRSPRSPCIRSRSGWSTSTSSTAWRSRFTTGSHSPSRYPPRSARSAASDPVRVGPGALPVGVHARQRVRVAGLDDLRPAHPGRGPARLAAAGLLALRTDVGHARLAPRDTRHRLRVGRHRDVRGAVARLPRGRDLALRFFLRSARARATLALT